MILPIIKIGDPILERICNEIDVSRIKTKFDTSFATKYANTLEQFIRNMIETARHHDALGLAANQVGELLRIFIFKENDEFNVAINPEIIEATGEIELDLEGCLSVPKIQAVIPRYKKIKVKFFNEKGHQIERLLSGLSARVFGHELDHLNAILFLSKAQKIIYVK